MKTIEDLLSSFLKFAQRQSRDTSKKRSGQARGMENLTLEDLLEVYHRQQGKCYYTDLPLKVENSSKIRKIAHIERISIDRVDSKLPYQKDNIVLCSTMANMMKQSYTKEEFMKVCRLVAKKFPEND